MVTITFDNPPNLPKTHFKDIEEFQIALNLMPQDGFELTDEQKAMLRERSEEAKKNPDDGMPFSEFLDSLNRKYA